MKRGTEMRRTEKEVDKGGDEICTKMENTEEKENGGEKKTIKKI